MYVFTVSGCFCSALVHRTLGRSTQEGELQPGGRGLELLKQVGEGDTDHLALLQKTAEDTGRSNIVPVILMVGFYW